jgi:hypothetical protein
VLRHRSGEHFAGYREFSAKLRFSNWTRQNKERKQWKFEVLDKIKRSSKDGRRIFSS